MEINWPKFRNNSDFLHLHLFFIYIIILDAYASFLFNYNTVYLRGDIIELVESLAIGGIQGQEAL